jgi:hypothetical protein
MIFLCNGRELFKTVVLAYYILMLINDSKFVEVKIINVGYKHVVIIP